MRSITPPLNPREPPEPIRLRIDQSGTIFWNDSPTPLSALRNMMETEVQRDVNNQPTLEIDVNEQAEYGVLAKVLAEAKNAQMQKIGFRSEEHTSELQSLMRISYAVFCLNKKNTPNNQNTLQEIQPIQHAHK